MTKPDSLVRTCEKSAQGGIGVISVIISTGVEKDNLVGFSYCFVFFGMCRDEGNHFLTYPDIIADEK